MPASGDAQGREETPPIILTGRKHRAEQGSGWGESSAKRVLARAGKGGAEAEMKNALVLTQPRLEKDPRHSAGWSGRRGARTHCI